VTPQVPLPWERLLWRSRSWHFSRCAAGERYLLTDVRLVRIARHTLQDIPLDDIGNIQRLEIRADRMFGTSTLLIHSRRRSGESITLTAIRRGRQLAVLLELLGTDPRAPRDRDAVRAALAWEPRVSPFRLRKALLGLAGVVIAVGGLAIGLHGKTAPVSYAPDDAIAPGGAKRNQADITVFMQRDVMPWARTTLGRIKGGADRITCETCHGRDADGRAWRMPAVAALPQPDVRARGWEIYNSGMDAQMRNAIYGYLAEYDNQSKATYMREVVLPGMAQLLHRPAYDFTRPYEYNRARGAIGCYHCHQVK
jgi:hypothetical protein